MISKKSRIAIVMMAAMLSMFTAGCAGTGGSQPEDQASGTTESASSPENTQMVTAELYLPNEHADGFDRKEFSVAADAGPQELVDLLIQRGALPEGAEVLDFRQNGKTLTVSMNHAYCDHVASMGNTGEDMILGSLVNTLLTYYKADELNITCEGNVFSTGSNVYDFPLAFYEDYAEDLPEAEAVLYLPTENADGFYTECISVGHDTEPQALIFELTVRGALPEGMTVLNFAQDGRTLSIDLSGDFRENVSSMGTTGEDMLLGSLVNTLLTFYEADEIYLNTEGKPLETEHNTYDFAVGFYD